jgi:galactokinase
LREIFEHQFGRAPEIAVSAPGRVNIIGEHTDYNGGLMLPVALPQRTHVLLSRRADPLVLVRSLDIVGTSSLEHYVLGEEQRRGRWIDYVQGVTRLARPKGRTISGCDVLISSEVPIGKGLSSSASLQVSLLRALNRAWNLELDDLAIARGAHRAETEFVGAPVGVMDQIASSLGNETSALLIDARTLAVQHVPIPDDVELAVLDSGIAHDHATGEYRVRRRECEEAAALLGVGQLSDLGPDELERLDALPETLSRRARHVLRENARVRATVRAFTEGDAESAGRCLSASHRSLRDDFEVSVPDIDRLQEIAEAEPEVFGARITGGGFGGAVVMLCRRPHAAAAAGHVIESYRALTHRGGDVLLPQAS